MRLSVEVEPPQGSYTSLEEKSKSITSEVQQYKNHVELISITNRPVFGLSAITMAKRVHKIINNGNPNKKRISLHLTTRMSHFDLFKIVLDAHRIGLSDLLPMLGDPRGPVNDIYFKNGFEILGFVSYIKTGDADYLSNRYLNLLNKNQLVGPIKNSNITIGSVIDTNSVKIINNNHIDIREKQIRFARKKERFGAEYLISQGIYDAQQYFSFIDEADLQIPVCAGVIPARINLIERFGLPINPLLKSKLRAQFSRIEERTVGNQIASQVYNELIEGGCKQIHVYSLGNPKNFFQITGIPQDENDINHIDYEGEGKLENEILKSNN